MKNNQQGFTLIELMSVVAIIAILAAIALPAYNQYRVRSAENACLGEAKAYTNSWLAASVSELTIPAWTPSACSAPGAAPAGTRVTPGHLHPNAPAVPAPTREAGRPSWRDRVGQYEE